MKPLKAALLGLNSAIIALNASALPLAAGKHIETTPVRTQISQTMQIINADPLLIYQLDVDEDTRQDLIERLLDPNEDLEQTEEDTGLIHNVNFFEDMFNGGRPQFPQQYPPYNPREQQPLPRAQQRPQVPYAPLKKITPPAEPNIVFNHDDMKNPEDWKVKYFDVVVVINKAPNAQTATVYRKKAEGALPEVVKNVKVSTGRETPEYTAEDKEAAGMAPTGHEPNDAYFSNTPTGYFTPYYLQIDRVSGDYEGAAMDHAVFFNTRGIATHRAPIGTEGQLGRRASGACVRMFQKDAQAVFWMVRATGGPITESEIAQRPGLHCGKKEGAERTLCIQRDAARKNKPSFKNELALMKQTQGFKTLDAAPMIPVFSRTGEVSKGEDGQIAMRQGAFKTLYVVENRPLARAPKKKK